MTTKKSGARGSRAFTVGELISELCLLPDHAEVSFRCLGESRGMQFSRLSSSTKEKIVVELIPAPQAVPVLPTRSRRNVAA